MKRALLLFLIPGFLILSCGEAIARQERFEAVVENITEENESYQKLDLKITSESREGEQIWVENGNLPMANYQIFRVGDRVMVEQYKDTEGNDIYYISDYVRRDALGWLFAGFVILTIAIAGKRGVMSIVGMGISFAVIFAFILPRIIEGNDPILTAIAGSVVIIPSTFYFSHGLNKKTSIAVAGTLAALLITGILAGLAVNRAKLSGFATEEAGFLQVTSAGIIDMKGLLLAGIIIGVLGVLDDITVSQSAIVQQLKEANPRMKFEELYKRAMNVGQDHIASMVNTLILVYTGAALPLLLLFMDSSQTIAQVINYELIADEIVRTLVGSIGLILAVPITSVLAAWVYSNEAKPNQTSVIRV